MCVLDTLVSLSWTDHEFVWSIVQGTKPPGMQASIFGACPKPGKIGRVVPGRVCGVKLWWGWHRWRHKLVRMGWQSIRIVGVSAYVIFILPQKIQKMAKCTFGYQLTWVIPDKVQRAVKWLCVCVCVVQGTMYLMRPDPTFEGK